VNTQIQLQSPFVLVIFGATGDLAQRKLVPALFHLFMKRLLPEHFFIVGFSRREYSTQDLRDFYSEAIKKYDTGHPFDPALWDQFCGKIYYQPGNFAQNHGYIKLIEMLKQFDTHLNACVPRFFYLATPPDQYADILKFLHETKLSEGCGQGSDKWTKVMIEKPFGRSLADAQALDKKLAQTFKEAQIYRIDHYLGKETVQNILAFRYGNTIFEPVWNSQFIDHVQITIAETLGVETRGNFYEGVGALRDMAQSHLLELMTAIATESPAHYDAEGIRAARAKTIAQINCFQPEEVEDNVVRGQYGSSVILASEARPGSETDSGVVTSFLPRMTNNIKAYREEPNVDPNSNTETFVALKLTLDNTRWRGIPFYLRTGKRLLKKAAEISVVFKAPTLKMFDSRQVAAVANVLTFHLEPNEGITVTLNAKKIGLTTVFEQVPMSFDYNKKEVLANPYERLLLDAMKGEQTLFTRTDEVLASWQLMATITSVWAKTPPQFPNYVVGSWGPKEADELIEKDGRSWLLK